MGKVAKLVEFSFMTRVIVDEDAEMGDVMELCKSKLKAKIDNDELLDNLSECYLDEECPYGDINGDIGVDKIHIAHRPERYDEINSLDLRSDLENNSIYDTYLLPQGDISPEGSGEEMYAIDCVVGGEIEVPIDSYLYSSRFEYEEDLKILGF